MFYLLITIGVVFMIFLGAMVGGLIICKKANIELRKWKNLSDKHLRMFLLLNEWIKKKQDRREIATYFQEHQYKVIAIYGMNYIGELLVKELDGSGIKILCGIDKNAENIRSNIEVLMPDDLLGNPDVFVVTAITAFDEIEDVLHTKTLCPIISVEDIIYEL